MSRQMRVIIAICVVSLLGARAMAQASSGPMPRAQQTNSAAGPKVQPAAPMPARGPAFPPHPCQQDTRQFCNAVQSGGGRKFYCLEKHRPELHPACRRFLAAVDQSYAAWAAERHETVAKMLADFYAQREDKSRNKKTIRIHVPGGRPDSTNSSAPTLPGPNKPTSGVPEPKKPVPASPGGNHESK